MFPILIGLAGYAIFKSARGEDQPIGRDAQGTEIYYAESSEKSKPNYVNRVFTGQKYECVEYARRWLVRNKEVYFDPINRAIDILDLTHARSVKKYNQLYPIVKVKKNPQIGDLIVFEPSESNGGYGHVAVITRVLQDKVQLSEQNYVERMTSDYTREIPLVDGVLQDQSIAGIVRVQK